MIVMTGENQRRPQIIYFRIDRQSIQASIEISQRIGSHSAKTVLRGKLSLARGCITLAPSFVPSQNKMRLRKICLIKH